MNIVEFTGFHNGERVWHVNPVNWDTMFDKHEPYAIVRENPRRGLTRSR
jgi:phage terminase large subunit-like protein